MSPETIPMFHELPIDNPKIPDPENCLAQNFRLRIDELNLEIADAQRETEIPWSTLMDWYRGKRKAQVADKRLYKLARFLKTSVEWLCFNVGEKEKNYE
jgi:predicted transcriptional regulator